MQQNRVLLALVCGCLVGCSADDENPGQFGGTGGTGGAATGGSSGVDASAGASGSGGTAGSGGTSGSSGAAGSGGAGGTGGTTDAGPDVDSSVGGAAGTGATGGTGGQDAGDAAPDVEDAAPDVVDAGPDPCDPPSPAGPSSGGWYCTDACGFGPYGSEVSSCEPFLACNADVAVAKFDILADDFSVLLPAESDYGGVHPGLDGNGVHCDETCNRITTYAFNVPPGRCARFTSSGERQFVVDPVTTGVDCQGLADCLITPSTHPDGATVLVLAISDAPVGWARVEMDDDWSGHPCTLTCP